MSAYYNECEPFAAQWLRHLTAAGLIAPGDVDERSITEVQPDDLRGYTQCHFFAGIGGWSLALRLAGWDDARPVWTGSCPCQPFSAAGKRRGTADERHLWPEFYRLIAECKPSVVFGEQVASKDGRAWLAGVRADLEAAGYAVGAADLCAAGVSAPHIRQRLWWVADTDRARPLFGERDSQPHEPEQRAPRRHDANGRGEVRGLGDAGGAGLEGRSIDAGQHTSQCLVGSAGANCWSDAIWIPCADGKSRRIKPGIEPLAHGVPGRVGRVRAYGNAIVPQVAAEFVSAFMECAP